MERHASDALPGKNGFPSISILCVLIVSHLLPSHILMFTSTMLLLQVVYVTTEYPSFDDISSTSLSTIKRIPVCACQAVGRVFQSIVFNESITAWKNVTKVRIVLQLTKGSILDIRKL